MEAEDCFAAATRYGLSAYDAAYLALAQGAGEKSRPGLFRRPARPARLLPDDGFAQPDLASARQRT